MTRDVAALVLGALAGLAAVAISAAMPLEKNDEEIEQISGCDDGDSAYRGAGDCIIAISPA